MSESASNKYRIEFYQSLIIALSLSVIHAYLTWGYITPFYGDYGVYLNQVERAAQGEIVYKDFFYSAPPLGIWVIGAVLQHFGSDLPQVWVYSLIIYTVIIISFAWFVTRIVPTGLQIPTTITTLLLSLAYTTWQSAPLPMGFYVASAPIGFLCLLFTVHAFLSVARTGGVFPSLLTGVFAGLCILAKQEYWLPALVLFGAAFFLEEKNGKRSNAIINISGFAATIGFGVVKIVTDSGLDALLGVMHGYGLVEIYGFARALPSWERLTAEVLSFVLILLICLISLKITRKSLLYSARYYSVLGVLATILTTIYIFIMIIKYQKYQIEGLPVLHTWPDWFLYQSKDGIDLAISSLRLLAGDVLNHLIPFVMPLLVLLVLVIYRHGKLLQTETIIYIVLLLMCFVARFRRGFEHLDWYNIQLEIPIYVAVTVFFGNENLRKAARIVLLVLGIIAFYAYWTYGYGPFTRKGAYQAIETSRGTIHIPEYEAELFSYLKQKINSIDPGKRRPVFSFGHNGGVSYFLRRPSPSPVTFGFLTSVIPPDQAVASIKNADPPYILIYHSMYEHAGVPVNAVNFRRWDQELQPIHYITHDLSYFNSIRRMCTDITDSYAQEKFKILIYDCKH